MHFQFVKYDNNSTWHHHLPDICKKLAEILFIDHYTHRQVVIDPNRYSCAVFAMERGTRIQFCTSRGLIYALIVLGHEMVHLRQFLNGEIYMDMNEGKGYFAGQLYAYGMMGRITRGFYECEIEPLGLQIFLARRIYKSMPELQRHCPELDVSMLFSDDWKERHKHFDIMALQRHLTRTEDIIEDALTF